MAKQTSVWLIEPLTNLHVGNESVVNFSVIDKAIQRDAATNLPCINSSSLKGALKEHLTQLATTKDEKEQLQKIFGSIKGIKEIEKGKAIFFDANLLAIPEPQTDKLYQKVSSDKVLDDFIKKAKALGASIQSIGDKEEWSKNDDDKFKTLCSDEALPIIARNCLENGQSENLWYEQVLPSHSVLATIIQAEEGLNLIERLNGQIVQIGANATIGYGFCKLTRIYPQEQQNK